MKIEEVVKDPITDYVDGNGTKVNNQNIEFSTIQWWGLRRPVMLFEVR